MFFCLREAEKIFLKKGLIFALSFDIVIKHSGRRVQNSKTLFDMERYSNGKEPHWKCGVPQGIVRSSRILSAKGQTSVWPFFVFRRTSCFSPDSLL